MKRWSFSLALLGGYLLTFQLWRVFPERTAFLVIGLLAVVLMTAGLLLAARRHYFANRTDFVLHGLVIVDVALESVSYEVFNAASQCILCVAGDPNTFHRGFSFCGCAAILGGLVGGYHWYAQRRWRIAANGAGGRHDVPATPNETASV